MQKGKLITQLADLDNRYRGVPVVIFGASGFIGRWVARALCMQGANVCLVVRDKKKLEAIFDKYHIGGDLFELDLRDGQSVQDFYRGIRPSITFNVAGYGVDRSEHNEESAYQINADLIKIICESILLNRDPKWLGQDIINVGSALEYGLIGGDLDEDSIPKPTTLYGKSKLAGTRFLMRCCESSAIKGLTARLFTVYGPGEHQGRLLPSLLEAAKNGEPVHLTTGNQKRDFTFVEDVAEGLLRLGLTTAKPGEVVNLATGKLTSVRMFTEAVSRILRIANNRLKFGSIPTRIEEMNHDEVAIGRLRQLLAWVPTVGINEGIRKTFAFENLHCDR